MTSEDYKELLSELAIRTVRLGYMSVQIHAIGQLGEAQVGYSIDPTGVSLVSDEPGSWKAQWVVIGYEDMCGDPIFIDIEARGFPVYTATHGTGKWEPTLIAISLRAFKAALDQISRVAKHRENPVKLEVKPISPAERASVMANIQQQNRAIDSTFWETWLEQ